METKLKLLVFEENIERCKRFEEPISMRKTMPEPRRGSQLGHRAESGKCLVEELFVDRHLMALEVRLRRTFHLILLTPSCARHRRGWLRFPLSRLGKA